MLDKICDGVLAGLEAGETQLHVTINRQLVNPDGLATTEFVVIEGFQCAEPTCDRPHHVRVLSAAPVYEYPDHLAHRHQAEPV